LHLECAKWLEEKSEIKSVSNRLLHGKLYHIDDLHRDHAMLGSSNFTLNGLGVHPNSNLELNLIVDSDRDRKELKAWFEEIWNDETIVEDVKPLVLKELKKLYSNQSPEFVYFKTLFEIFEHLRTDMDDWDGFEDSAVTNSMIWNALYDFQKDGVKAAVQKLDRFDGCIIADSVGLGKTYSALATIRYYELKNKSVLVLCPKKLRENWTVYLAQNNSELNPFLGDRFRYTVLSHTDLSREAGVVDGVDLAALNWGNFDLVVIDESHNFRNNSRGKRDEDGNTIRKSRYERLMTDIIQFGAYGVSAKAFLADLGKLPDKAPLTLRLNSPGGSVFDAVAIYNALTRHADTVTVSIDGIAASAASYIAMAGDEIIMPENAFLMIHEPSGMVMGTASDMRAMAEALDKIGASLLRGYAAKSGKPEKDVAKLMAKETWLDAAEALDMGFADTMTEPVKIAASFDVSRFQNTPPEIIEAVKAKDEPVAVEPESEAEAEPKPDASPVGETEPGADPETIRSEAMAYAKTVVDRGSAANGGGLPVRRDQPRGYPQGPDRRQGGH
jgi:ATP-dependent protease ClpP protease subunit